MKSDHGRRLARGSLVVLAADGLAIASALICIVYLTRTLGPEEFGLWALASGLALWVEWSVVSLFSRATIKLISESDERSAVWSAMLVWQLGVAFAVAVALFMGAEVLARGLNEPRLAPLLRWFAFEIPLFTCAQGLRNFHVGGGDIVRRALVSLTKGGVRLLLILGLVHAGFGVTGAVLGSIGATIIELLVSGWGRNLTLFSRRPIAAELWRYAYPTFLFSATVRVLERIDLILLKAFGVSAAVAGLYGAAQNASRILLLFAVSLSPLLLATLSRLYSSNDVQSAREITAEIFRLITLLTPFVALVAGGSHQITVLVFGARFAGAADLISILMFGGLCSLFIHVASAVFTATGRPSRAFWIMLPFFLGAMIAYWFVIPVAGPSGAAWVTTACLAGAAVCFAVTLQRTLAISFPLRALCCVVGISLPVFLAMRWTPSSGFSFVAASIGIFLLVLGTLVLARVVTPMDWERLRLLFSAENAENV